MAENLPPGVLLGLGMTRFRREMKRLSNRPIHQVSDCQARDRYNDENPAPGRNKTQELGDDNRPQTKANEGKTAQLNSDVQSAPLRLGGFARRGDADRRVGA